MEKILTFTKAEISLLKKCVSEYKPYSINDPEYSKFDGDCEINRLKATTAKKILDDISNHPENYIIE